MRAEILRAREAGDSVGGVVECIVTGLPAGVGSPMFQGLESHLAAALFAIPAVKGVEFGSGFGAAGMRGSAHNDPFILEDGAIRTASIVPRAVPVVEAAAALVLLDALLDRNTDQIAWSAPQGARP